MKNLEDCEALIQDQIFLLLLICVILMFSLRFSGGKAKC